jgi:hypothetical protein
VLILLLATACTNVSKRSDIVEDNQKLKAFNRYYSNWELNQAENELNQLEIEENEKIILTQKLKTREKNRAEFDVVLKKLAEALKANDFATLEEYVANNILNTIKLRELKKNDYSNVKIYFGKKKFYFEEADTLMLINYLEETTYINLKFELIESEDWQLISFEEKR